MKNLFLEINVSCDEGISVKGKSKTVVMVPFTGEAHGDFFNGQVVGKGCDTQKFWSESGEDHFSLSARYMLSGKDFTGRDCHIFIENNVTDNEWTPSIVTDSEALAEWEYANLRSEIESTSTGVIVRIFKI